MSAGSDQPNTRQGSDDRASAVAGVVCAVLVHLVVALFALRAGADEGNIRQATAHTAEPDPTHDEEIIEGELLRQGGGGQFDPRHEVHREVPVQAEEVNRPFQGTSREPTPGPRVDAGVRRDPNSVLTQREILGRGNPDLAERLARMMESETQAPAGTMQGPGHPDGSVNGTETDPNRAGTGWGAKIRSFLQRELHFPATAPAAARRPFRLRIVISDDGGSLARGQIVTGSGDDTVDGDLTLQLAQLAENHTAIPELTDEERLHIRGQGFTVRYVPP